MKNKVKVNYLRWELVPVYNEVYIDEDELKEISKIDCDEERMEYIEDLLRDNEFIWTSQDTDWDSPDYNGELDKFYIKNNEHSIYVSSIIEIDGNTVCKDFSTYIEKEVNEILEEYNSLEVYTISSIIRDKKLNKILKKN
jgi:hypothetical protein